MKLIKQTYFATLRWLIPILIIGSVFCFYMIQYISYEETDEFLTYEMNRLITYHKEYNQLPEFHKVAEIIPEASYKTPIFKDTSLLETADGEFVPHRELRFSIEHKGKDVGIVLRHLLLGTDDVFEGTLMIVGGLTALFLLFIFITLSYTSKKIWHPFYITLKKLQLFKISDPVPVFEQTKTEEFNELNETLEKILHHLSLDFKHNKEFTENVSHELQTHLAVIRMQTESLLNKTTKIGEHNEIKKIYAATSSLMQIQKSLFLLSKISNGEFSDVVPQPFHHSLEKAIPLFEEFTSSRSISISTSISNCFISIDNGLSEILINNLLKNAVKYNVDSGFISISLNQQRLIIKNSCLDDIHPSTNLTKRYVKSEKGNLGLGLSIVAEICQLYGFDFIILRNQKNVHEVQINFHSS